MKSLIDKEGYIQEDLNSLEELIFEADTIEELFEIEEQIGIHDFIGSDDWEALSVLLRKVRSPFASIYEQLNERWDEVERTKDKK